MLRFIERLHPAELFAIMGGIIGLIVAGLLILCGVDRMVAAGIGVGVALFVFWLLAIVCSGRGR
jgi:hypothetical protein